MAEEWEYGNEWGATYDPWYPETTNAGGVTDYFQNPAYQSFTGWGDPTGVGSSGDTRGGNWWDSVLGGLGHVGSFLGQNAGTLGPLLQAGGSLAGGALGSNAAQEASAAQSSALNRGIDLQTAQWLQQQQNLAPYLQAGQQGLSTLQGLAGREQPALPGATPGIRSADYNASLPDLMPGWRPQAYQGPDAPNAQSYQWNPQQGPQAQDYRYTPGTIPSAAANRWTPGQGPQAQDYNWTPGQGPQAESYAWNPGQGPRAQDYRYTPGQTPDAAQYASQAPQLYQGAMPGTQVSQLTGQQVLDQDPGAAFRQTEARKALEASAAARGGLMSGSTLGALQRQSQDLASQEYGNAFNRMMQRDVEQYGRNWGQYQQNWTQGIQGAELGMRTQAQNFGQAMSASQLREQVNQQAQQMGWNQAQAEAAFREQMAQQSSQQGFGHAQTAASFREQMAQQASQQGFGHAQTAAAFREQMAQQASQQGYAQQMSETELRERVNQQAMQQGWSQAQAEAAFREQMGQQASQQGWGQALQGQQNQYNQGLQSLQWNQGQQQQFTDEIYKRMLAQNQLLYGRDVAQNTTDYDRQQALYRQQLGQHLLPWEQSSTLAGLGSKATGQYGEQSAYNSRGISDLLAQLGTAQGTGAAAQGAIQNKALGGATNAFSSLLANLNA